MTFPLFERSAMTGRLSNSNSYKMGWASFYIRVEKEKNEKNELWFNLAHGNLKVKFRSKLTDLYSFTFYA